MSRYFRFNRITDKPFVEILKEDGSFVTKDVEVGISDGINVEILKGLRKVIKLRFGILSKMKMMMK